MTVHYVGIAECPIAADQLADDAARNAGVDRSLISLTVEV